MVISDTAVLNSLPKREMVCGYAEILKHALILDKKFFFWLQKNGEKIINLNNYVKQNHLKFLILNFVRFY